MRRNSKNSSTTSTAASQRRRNGNTELVTLDDVINVNVSGVKYVLLRKTLEQFPSTLLGNEARRRHYYVEDMNSYVFQRSRVVFEAILFYYHSSGSLLHPSSVPMDVFAQEAS